MITGRIKKWSEFQHYKDRSPPWIKLERKLLDDYEFACLPIASKALAPFLWLLASESHDGEVRIDHEWLAFRLRWDEEDVRAGLIPLIEKGFVIVASDALAECLQAAIPEREGEGETEREKDTPIAPIGGDQSADCDSILDAYHTLLPKCLRIAVLNPKRKRRIAAATKLAKQVCTSQGWQYAPADFWQAYFGECQSDPWLRGEVSNPKNPNWKQNLDVLLAEDRFAGIMDRAIAAMKVAP